MLPMVYLVRHGNIAEIRNSVTVIITNNNYMIFFPGETDWTKSGRYTSTMEIGLNSKGKEQVAQLSRFTFENPRQGNDNHFFKGSTKDM